MARYILPLLIAIFLLSSCIPVHDFGAYWDKGTVDPALLGWWKNPVEKDQDQLRVMNHFGTYYFDTFDKNGWEKEKEAQSARTLSAGKYRFLMVKNRQKDRYSGDIVGLVRYKIDGNRLWVYSLNDERMGAFLKKNYPGIKNIGLSESWQPFRRAPSGRFVKSGHGRVIGTVSIQKLDNDVYKVLSEIPDTAKFWTPAATGLQHVQ